MSKSGNGGQSIVAVGRWHSLGSKQSYSWNHSRCMAAEPWEVAVATAVTRAAGWREPGRAHRAEAKAREAEARAGAARATVAVAVVMAVK